MVSFKTKIKETAFYIYGAALITFFFFAFVILKTIFDVGVVSFDTSIIVALMAVVSIMIAGLALDITTLKHRLKKKRK